MTTDKTKKEMAVAALRNGTVIDHIPSASLFKAVKILGLENMGCNITIGYNLDSKKLGKKGIIKVADTEFDKDTLDRIAVIAPTAVINTIRDYNVVDKSPVELPHTIVGIVACDNPKCITNNEPMRTRFDVIEEGSHTGCATLKCRYCNHTVIADKAKIL